MSPSRRVRAPRRPVLTGAGAPTGTAKAESPATASPSDRKTQRQPRPPSSSRPKPTRGCAQKIPLAAPTPNPCKDTDFKATRWRDRVNARPRFTRMTPVGLPRITPHRRPAFHGASVNARSNEFQWSCRSLQPAVRLSTARQPRALPRKRSAFVHATTETRPPIPPVTQRALVHVHGVSAEGAVHSSPLWRPFISRSVCSRGLA